MACSCGETGRCPECKAPFVPVTIVRDLERSGELGRMEEEALARKGSARVEGLKGEIASIVSEDVLRGRLGRESCRFLIRLVKAEVRKGQLLESVRPECTGLVARIATRALDEIVLNGRGYEAAYRGVAAERVQYLDGPARSAQKEVERHREQLSCTSRVLNALDSLASISARERELLEEDLTRTRQVEEISGHRSRIARRDEAIQLLPGAIENLGLLLGIIDLSGSESKEIRFAVGDSLAQWLQDLPPVSGVGVASPGTGVTGSEVA